MNRNPEQSEQASENISLILNPKKIKKSEDKNLIIKELEEMGVFEE